MVVNKKHFLGTRYRICGVQFGKFIFRWPERYNVGDYGFLFPHYGILIFLSSDHLEWVKEFIFVGCEPIGQNHIYFQWQGEDDGSVHQRGSTA
jgi:hypothetical protein